MQEDKIVPKFTFGEYADGELQPIEPLKKKISKTMEVTENFTLLDVLQYVAKIRKAIEDKEAELMGLEAMLKAYEEEIDILEESLGIQKMQDEYEKEVAEENESIVSPYTENGKDA